MKTYLITNARVVNEGTITETDVLIRNGRIEKIAASVNAPDAAIIDAKGQYLMPGLIDDQVHFREPGLTHKAHIKSEARAAVAGGITSLWKCPIPTLRQPLKNYCKINMTLLLAVRWPTIPSLWARAMTITKR